MEACKNILDVLDDVSNWDLAGEYEHRRIKFRREEPMDLSDRFIDKEISIEVCKGGNPRDQKSLARILNFEIVNIHVWMIIRPQSDERYQVLLDGRQLITEKIDTIILANQRSVSGIKYIASRKWDYPRAIDVREIPDSLHSVNELVCHYET